MGVLMDAVTEALAHFQKLEDEDQAMADAIEAECVAIQKDEDRCIAAAREFVDAMDPDTAAQKLAEYMASHEYVANESWSWSVMETLSEWSERNIREAIESAAKSAIARRVELSQQDEARAAQREDWE